MKTQRFFKALFFITAACIGFAALVSCGNNDNDDIDDKDTDPVTNIKVYSGSFKEDSEGEEDRSVQIAISVGEKNSEKWISKISLKHKTTLGMSSSSWEVLHEKNTGVTKFSGTKASYTETDPRTSIPTRYEFNLNNDNTLSITYYYKDSGNKGHEFRLQQ